MIGKDKKRIVVTLPEDLLSKMDEYIAQGYMASRTDLVEECLRRFLDDEKGYQDTGNKKGKIDEISLMVILMGLQQIVRMSDSLEKVDRHISELIKKVETTYI